VSLFEIVAVSVPDGTMWHMADAAAPGDDTTMVSHAGVPLTRSVTFRFTLDLTREQHRQLLAHAGAFRLAFNAGQAAGFPKFKSRHKTTPAFRLRAKYQEGSAPAVRPTGPRAMRFPKLGELRVHEHTGQLAKPSSSSLTGGSHPARRARAAAASTPTSP
jgi:hypothetical protein